jgi:DNA-binding response OmpR family regulator
VEVVENCRVLCVDDHADTSVMLKYLLGSSDYEVQTADTIEVAIEFAKNSKFDLFILDRRFPDGTGVELCRELRKISPDTPIIFYSGDAYEFHRDEAFGAGADAYVSKPEIDRLLTTVNSLLVDTGCEAAT